MFVIFITENQTMKIYLRAQERLNFLLLIPPIPPKNTCSPIKKIAYIINES
jgi:hypothetical protein